SGVVDVIKLGAVTVDFARRVATGPAGTILLTNREFEILQFLAERANRTVHRDQLVHQVLGSLSPGPTRRGDRTVHRDQLALQFGGTISRGTIRSVDRAIARLREKIEPDTKRPRYLITAY